MDYFNDPELNGKYLGTITKDFATSPTPSKSGRKPTQTKSRGGALPLPVLATVV